MVSKWVTKKIGDIATLQRGHDLPTSKRINGNIPIMGSAGITGYHNVPKAFGEGVFIGRSGVGSMGVVSKQHLLQKRKVKQAEQNEVLSKLRDTLLPKLISGELRLPPEMSKARQQAETTVV